jgi:hypothetical protein
LALHSKVKVWIAVNVAAEAKLVLAAVKVQRKHPVVESGKIFASKKKFLKL